MKGAAKSTEPESADLILHGGIVLRLRFIPKATHPFRMGSRGQYPDEEPIHAMQLEDAFWLGVMPVTQAQFDAWLGATGQTHEYGFPCLPEHPAENVDWRQANQFCGWLASLATEGLLPGVPAGFGFFCLPTEAEWEYACRAGTETDYHTGDGEAALAEAGWFVENAGGRTQPVGQKQPNAFGLHDLHGNVWEWCHDPWNNSAYRERVEGDLDPGKVGRSGEWQEGLETMLQDKRYRMVRGGSWSFSMGWCRSTCRRRGRPDVRGSNRGFRVCLVSGLASPAGGKRENLSPNPVVRVAPDSSHQQAQRTV